ncbi:MAG: hypothetical protein ACLP5H_15980 [Desulfomonilaceae bacterium]
MIRGLALFISLGLCLLTGTPLLSDTNSGPCDTEHARWSKAYESLQAGMERYRQIKYESVSPRIAREMGAHERGASIARIVEVVLKERRERLAELGQRCLEFADLERSSFEDWRRCATVRFQRRDNSSAVAFKSIVRERDLLMAELQDLLLDEAYVQYKNHRAPAPPASPSYEANQPSNIRYR